jgi:hypothetical protein
MNAVADLPQQRHHWFAPFLPGVAVAGVAAAILLAALLIGKQPIGDPSSSVPPAPSSAAVPSAMSTPSPPPSEEPTITSLLTEGDHVDIDAVDASGTWGSISVTRGAEVGGYREVARVDLPPSGDATGMYFQNDPSVFYLELEILYTAERDPEPRLFGGHDWALTTGETRLGPIEIMGGRAGLSMGEEFPGPVIELIGDTIGGDLRFAIPRELADSTLDLVYHPAGADAAVWSIPVRASGPAPAPVPSVVPPALLTYVERENFAFSVIESDEADRLFANPDTCTNPIAGYTVTYPDDWYTNTEVGDIPPCTWFSPTFYEVDDPTRVPPEVAFVIRIDRSGGATMSGQELDIPPVDSIDGRPVRRSEQVGVGGGFMELGTFIYDYRIGLDGRFPDEDGPASTLYAGLAWELDDDPATYTLNKAVLDRVIASIEFTD